MNRVSGALEGAGVTARLLAGSGRLRRRSGRGSIAITRLAEPIALVAHLAHVAPIWIPLVAYLPLALAPSLCGCASAEGKNGRSQVAAGKLTKALDPMKLRGEIQRLLDEANADVLGTSSEVAAKTQDPRVREATLLWKIRNTNSINLIRREQDPRQCFLVVWVVVVQARKYAEDEASRRELGEYFTAMLDLTRRYEQRILEMGRRHFGDQVIAEAAEEVEEIASSYPLTGDVLVDSTTVTKIEEQAQGIGSDALSILQMPLSPFTSLKGVGDTPSAIRDFTQVAGNIGDVVQNLPRRTRWETELLLYELDSLKTLVEARKTMESASKSLESLSKTAATLPADLRKETEALLEKADASQATLQKTLQETQKTAEGLRETLATADSTAKSVREATGAFADAGKTWDSTAKSVNAVLESYRRLTEPSEEEQKAREAAKSAAKEKAKEAGPPEEAESPDTVKDITQMAERIRLASEELRLLLNDLESGKLKSALAEVGETAEGSIGRAKVMADSVVDRAMTWVAALAGAAVVLLVAGKLALDRRRARSAPTGG